MTEKETDELLNDCINGIADKQSIEKLEEIMLEDPQVREKYISLMNLDCALKEEAERADTIEVVADFPKKSYSAILTGLAAAVALLLALNLTYKMSTSDQAAAPPLKKPDEPIQSGIALISGIVDFEGKELLYEGQILEEGKLVFSKGAVQVDFYSGASLIFEGPVDVDLIDPLNITCFHGKIRARVSEQAKGFKIKTADVDVVDLGTEFGLEIPQQGQASVFVYEGEVELHSKKGRRILKSITADQGVTWKKEVISPVPMRNDFISFKSIAEMNRKLNGAKLAKWHSFAEKIRQRKDVILFYSFEGIDKRPKTVLNESLNQLKGLNGAVVGCRISEGRWPGKKALDFKSTGDRIKVDIPGKYESMTLSCWVKVESFDRWLSSLLLTDNYDMGELHWQLSDSGEIILGARSNGNTFSPPVISPVDLGRWIHVATVYNSSKKEIVHYLNGIPVVRDVIKNPQLITLGKSDIGNWTTRTRNHPIRSLNGRLDEFIIFSSALSDKDVYRLYRQELSQ